MFQMELMLLLGMLTHYTKVCSAYVESHPDKQIWIVFCTFWRKRLDKTILAFVGALLGLHSLPILRVFYPEFLSDEAVATVNGLFSFAAGYSGAQIIDEVVSKFHKYLNKI